MPDAFKACNIKIVPAPKILGKTKAKSKEPLRNTGNNRTLLVIVVVNVLTGFLQRCYSKEELEEGIWRRLQRCYGSSSQEMPMKPHGDKYRGKNKMIENFTSWSCRLNTTCQLEVRINLLRAVRNYVQKQSCTMTVFCTSESRERVKSWREKRDNPGFNVKRNVVCTIHTQIKGILQKLRYKVLRREVRVFLSGQMWKAILCTWSEKRVSQTFRMGTEGLSRFLQQGCPISPFFWAKWNWAA